MSVSVAARSEKKLPLTVYQYGGYNPYGDNGGGRYARKPVPSRALETGA
jgi:hypothetical protein